MKTMLVFIGLLVILAGLLPLLVKYVSALDIIPTTGIWYQVIIIVIGVIAVLYGMKGRKSVI